MHAITKLRHDIACSRRRTQAAPSRNVGKLAQPTTEREVKRKRKEQLEESKTNDQKELFEEKP